MLIFVDIIQIQYLCIHGESLGVSYMGKKIKAEKKRGGIESNVIEEYTPLFNILKYRLYSYRLFSNTSSTRLNIIFQFCRSCMILCLNQHVSMTLGACVQT